MKTLFSHTPPSLPHSLLPSFPPSLHPPLFAMAALPAPANHPRAAFVTGNLTRSVPMLIKTPRHREETPGILKIACPTTSLETNAIVKVMAAVYKP